MCYFIGIEDLVANALIEALQKLNKRRLTYDEIESYGAQVIKILNHAGERAILILSRDNTEAMLRDYSDYFVEYDEYGEKGIVLKEGKEAVDLIDEFRGYLSLDVLRAFVNQESIQVLNT